MDERDYKAMNEEMNPPLKQCNVSGSLPLLEDCKKAATDYADKKGGGNYGEIFRAYQEGINWALNWVSKRQ
jgi:hypothetical protein